jgi:hypothetical protein
MRMPIFSYFLVTGTVLAGLLVWIGGESQSSDSGLKTSQAVGLPKPFKAPPDTSPYGVTGVNFAAGREAQAAKPAKTVEKPEVHVRRQKVANKYYPKVPTWNHLAEYAYDRFGIH